MSQRDDTPLDVPNLGPAKEPSPAKVPESSATERAVQASDIRTTGMTTLVLILLTAACSGLGYRLFDIQQSHEKHEQVLTVALERAQQRILALETLLHVEADNPENTAGDLVAQVQAIADVQIAQQNQLVELSKALAQVNKEDLLHLKQQVADYQNSNEQVRTTLDLLEQVNQQHRSHIDSLMQAQQTLHQQQQTIAPLAQTLAQLEAQVKQLQEHLNAVQSQAQTVQQTAQQQQAHTQQLQRVQTTLAALQTHIAVVEEAAAEGMLDVNVRIKKQSAQLARLKQAPKPQTNSAQRISALEKDIQAIDASRRQVNRELLTLKQRLNRLQARGQN